MTPDARPLVRPVQHATLVSDSSGRITGITLRGELDIAVVDELAALGRGLPAAPAVEIDLDAVSFMDSAGLWAVLDLRDGLADRGCRVSMRTPSSPRLTVLDCAEQLGWPARVPTQGGAA